MTVIIEFPRQATQPTAASDISDAVLHELLRKAVVAHRAGEARVPGSLGHRHHLAVALAVLEAIEIVMEGCSLANELEQTMTAGIKDVKVLARIAREYDGPESA
ncbi:hypothetical protein [Arthrobacter sp. UYCo732]|uniref:hypothetical protein n=1 Tax=Arthrobacter sp. UYCo732 TaxID=3156336 RepID=UPI003395F880